jgi:uncharacterized membrane protein
MNPMTTDNTVCPLHKFNVRFISQSLCFKVTTNTTLLVENIEEYQLETAKKKNKPNGSKIKKNCKSKSNKKQSNNEQQPGPSKENTSH